MSFEDAQLTLLMDWDRTGWCRYLPFEGRMLWDVFCDATTSDIDGDLDTLVDWHLCMKYPPLGLQVCQVLDAPLHYNRYWSDQRRLERLFAKADLPYPRTTRQVAEVGVAMGLYLRIEQGRVTRWRAPPALPLPTEVLPMTHRQRCREDDHRWHAAGYYPASQIADLLHSDGQPAETVTSIAHLARCLDEDPETIRQGLAHLCDTRFDGFFSRPAMRVFAGAGERNLVSVSPERLLADDPCVLVPHWRRLTRQYGLAERTGDENAPEEPPR
jgi:hypothetical protein